MLEQFKKEFEICKAKGITEADNVQEFLEQAVAEWVARHWNGNATSDLVELTAAAEIHPLHVAE